MCLSSKQILFLLIGLSVIFLLHYCREPGQTGGGTTGILENEKSNLLFCYSYFLRKDYVIFLQIAGTANNIGLDLLMNMFGGLGAGSLNVPNTPDG